MECEFSVKLLAKINKKVVIVTWFIKMMIINIQMVHLDRPTCTVLIYYTNLFVKGLLLIF